MKPGELLEKINPFTAPQPPAKFQPQRRGVTSDATTPHISSFNCGNTKNIPGMSSKRLQLSYYFLEMREVFPCHHTSSQSQLRSTRRSHLMYLCTSEREIQMRRSPMHCIPASFAVPLDGLNCPHAAANPWDSGVENTL